MSGNDHARGLPPELSSIHLQASELGLSFLGSCPADPFGPVERLRRQEEYSSFLDAGAHAGMGFLKTHEHLKYRAEVVLPNCRSVLLFGLNYYREDDIDGTAGTSIATDLANSGGSSSSSVACGRVARYARGRDYHKVFGKKLLRLVKELAAAFPEYQFRRFVDAGPLSERAYASAVGACVTGRNTLSISPEFGSFFFLGEILSTREFPSHTAVSAGQGCPRGCRSCINVCPTGALYAPHRMNAGRCISYLTIEHRGHIPRELQELMGDMVFGCDLCQDVCPLNAPRRPTTEPDLLRSIAGGAPDLRTLLQLRDHEDTVAWFGGSPLMRAGRRGLVRNACIAAANIGAMELLPLIAALCEDEDPVVAATAADSRKRLNSYSISP